MVKNERTPTSAATLAGAGKESTGRGAFPCPQFSTEERQTQGRIAPLLGHGQSAAVPLKHLVVLTGLDERSVRIRIERERRNGVPILSDNAHGYYLPETQDEIMACVSSLRRRAGEINRTADAIEKGGVGCG